MSQTGMRIGIVGCAGTGKSSLARALSEALGINLLESKVITQDILARDGYDYSSGEQVERFLANTIRQNEILRRTIEMEDNANDAGFVSDRTVVDLAAYAVAEMHEEDAEGLTHIVNTCRERVKGYDYLFLCPWANKPFEKNEKRTLNPWYQFKIHALEVGIMDSWGSPFIIVEVGGTQPRVESIVDLLKSNGQVQ